MTFREAEMSTLKILFVLAFILSIKAIKIISKSVLYVRIKCSLWKEWSLKKKKPRSIKMWSLKEEKDETVLEVIDIEYIKKQNINNCLLTLITLFDK